METSRSQDVSGGATAEQVLKSDDSSRLKDVGPQAYKKEETLDPG